MKPGSHRNRTHCDKGHALPVGIYRCQECLAAKYERANAKRRKNTRVKGTAKYSFPKPSSLNQMAENDLCWVAGWLEGEGCFGLQPRGKWSYPKISAASTDLDTLTKVKTITGVGVITERKKQKAHHKQCWVWQVQAINDTMPLLKALYPRMMERRSTRIMELIEVGQRII